jgi:hypothetical protein
MNLAAEANQKKISLKERTAKIQSFIASIAREKREKPGLDYSLADAKIGRAKQALARDAEKFNNTVRTLKAVRDEVDELKEQMRIAKLSAEFDGDESPEDVKKREEDALLFQTAIASIRDRAGKAFADLSFGDDGTVTLGKSFQAVPEAVSSDQGAKLLEEKNSTLGFELLDVDFEVVGKEE